MKTLNKEFVYKTFRFNIKVELNYSAERHVGGKVMHKITMNDMGTSNWYKTVEVDAKEPKKLETMITGLENMAKDFAEERLGLGLSEIEIKLMQLGFK